MKNITSYKDELLNLIKNEIEAINLLILEYSDNFVNTNNSITLRVRLSELDNACHSKIFLKNVLDFVVLNNLDATTSSILSEKELTANFGKYVVSYIETKISNSTIAVEKSVLTNLLEKISTKKE